MSSLSISSICFDMWSPSHDWPYPYSYVLEYSGIPYCMANDVRDCAKATPLVSVQILVWQLGCCHIPHSGKDYELLKTNETYINQYDASFPITEVINYFIDEFFTATSGARSIGDYNSISCWLRRLIILIVFSVLPALNCVTISLAPLPTARPPLARWYLGKCSGR